MLLFCFWEYFNTLHLGLIMQEIIVQETLKRLIRSEIEHILMLDENKQCKNCGFDTMAIVTVETSDWEYCPVCGSRFVTVKDDIEGNIDEDSVKMRDIPLEENSDNPEEQSDDKSNSRKIELNSEVSDEESVSSEQSESSTQGNKSKTEDEKVSDMSDEDLDEMLDDSDFVEDELDRLRKFVGDEDKDN